ncbi:MAG: hypothetical protein JWM86_308, partial [Thermoleophilia bacterium]|nr:hypothetical protein [Thermoleophilia bacterium]
VRQHADASGGMVAPHTVWLELERLAELLPHGACTRRTRGLGAVVPHVDELVFASDAAVAVARSMGAGTDIIDAPDHVRAAVARADRDPMPLTLDGVVGERLGAVDRIAATELEAYARCPVQWLLRREAPIDDLDAERTGLDAGSYAHALLELAVPSLLQRASSGVSPEMVLDEVRQDARRAAHVDVAHALQAHELARVEEQVLDVLRAEIAPERVRPDRVWVEIELTSTPREPRDGEAARPRPPWPTPGLEIDGVEIHGRVDRIDEFPDGLVLHDYKSGTKTLGPGKLVAEDHLQLGLYWLAIERAEGAPRPIAAPYRALPKGAEAWGLRSAALKEYGLIPKGSRPPKDDVLRDVLDATEARARELVTGIRGGELDLSHIDPEARSSPCGYCSLQAICRIEERRA